MPHKNHITNGDHDQQRIIEARVPKSRKSENQSVDAPVSDHSSEVKHRRLTGLYQVPRSENEVSPCATESRELTSIAKPAATPYRSSKDPILRIQEESAKHIIVTGAFPPGYLEPGILVETIRDPENPRLMVFLHWENGSVSTFHSIEREGQIFLPPDPTSRSFPLLSLPDGVLPCGNSYELLDEIAATISKFVKLRPDQYGIVAVFVMASWFPDCFEAAPYLWVVGPLGSGKTKLLKLLRALCRRGLIAGDLWSGSVYKLVDTWDPTLIIDEFEQGNSVANVELHRLLRTGSTPAVPTFRNGRPFSNYGLKIIASRQPLADAALSNRGLTISLLPTKCDTPPLDEATLQKVEQEFQRKLCMFRLQNYAAVKNFSNSPNDFNDLSPRMRQIARALAAPFLGDAGITSELLKILGEYDDEGRIERSLEPEWLVAEGLMVLCHEGIGNGRGSISTVSEILVGGLAARVNQSLADQLEDIRLGAKKVGMVLRSLGLRTTRLGRSGRGFMLTDRVKRKIHEVAAQLGIDRRTIAARLGLQADYGGVRCALCEELGLTGGLSFTEIKDMLEYPSPWNDET
jgi:hypothetical protein